MTSADVKYAIERAYTANVAGPLRARLLRRRRRRARSEPGDYKEVPGIETPDDQTIVFKLSKGTGAALAGALAMPISIPVPKEYAQKYDRENPSTYREHMVFTGPYMLENDGAGDKVTGYVPGKTIHLVRNPDYAPVDDFRPAFLDEIDIQAGNDDTAVATRRILSGESMAAGEIEPAGEPAQAAAASRTRRSSRPCPGGGWRMISMDTSRPPFDDIDVRKAVIAGFDRVAARQQRGGEALGPIAQHYIPPGMAGFEESGGAEADPEFDWMQNPEGDRNLSAEYFKKAGFARASTRAARTC